MTEKALVRRILREIKAHGGKAIKLHGLERGCPDIIACIQGRCVVIEAKVGRNRPTALQTRRLQEWRAAGALTYLAREDFHIRLVK